MCVWFETRDDFDAAHARLEAQGLRLIHAGVSAGVNVRFAYFAGTDETQMPLIEISEAMLPAPARMFEAFRQEARSWNGTPPWKEAVVSSQGERAGESGEQDSA